MVEDWPYMGTDFTEDPDLPLPEGEEWDEDLGMFFFYVLYIFFVFVNTCMF